VDPSWFVAGGTLALAATTYALARQGRAQTLARSRPVLLVGEPYSDARGGIPGIEMRDGTLYLMVWNFGNGPALDVSATIPDLPQARRLAAPALRPLAAGSFLVLAWTGPFPDTVSGWVDCHDVGDTVLPHDVRLQGTRGGRVCRRLANDPAASRTSSGVRAAVDEPRPEAAREAVCRPETQAAGQAARATSSVN